MTAFGFVKDGYSSLPREQVLLFRGNREPSDVTSAVEGALLIHWNFFRTLNLIGEEDVLYQPSSRTTDGAFK